MAGVASVFFLWGFRIILYLVFVLLVYLSVFFSHVALKGAASSYLEYFCYSSSSPVSVFV